MTLKEASNWFLTKDNFLILTHRSPDGDTIGSASGLCIALREQGKTAFLLTNEEITTTFLPYVEGLQSSDFKYDYVVSVDIAAEKLFPENAEVFKGKVDLAIDHHSQREDFGIENCVYSDKAATGEMIYEIVEPWGPLSQAVATPLYVAVSTDTGCFVYGNTTPDCHRVAGELIATGLDVRAINKILFQTVTLTRLRLQAKLVESMRLYNQGSCAIVCLTQAMIKELNATEHDLEDLSSFVGQIEGVATGITVREKEGGFCRLSIRSNPAVLKANAVCGKLGGGGHDAASGASFTGTVEETVEAIIKAIEEVQGQKVIPVL